MQRFVRPLRELMGLETEPAAGPTPVFSTAESVASRTRVLSEGQRRERLVGAATRVMGQASGPVAPVRTRRAMLNVRHDVELAPAVHPLPFRSPGAAEATGRKLVIVRDWTPSTQQSYRGSFRSDVSALSTALPRHFLPVHKSSHGPQSFVHSISPLSYHPTHVEQMRSASAATLTGGPVADLSFSRRPVSAFEHSPAGRPSPFPRSEPTVGYEQHIYQNQMQAIGRVQRPPAGPIPFHSPHLFSASMPFNRNLILRDSQRRRFDDRIAQIRRERESTRVGRIRAQVTSQPAAGPPATSPLPQHPTAVAQSGASSSLSSASTAEEEDERLCQV